MDPDVETRDASSGSTTEVAGDESTESSGSPPIHAVNGKCVEVGMRFLDVFSCDSVFGPSPKQPPVSTSQVTHDPAVLDDPEYAWVVSQLEACSCTCCHAEDGVGSYKWSHDFAPAWTDAAPSEVLDALGFSGGLNTVDPDDNFGFSRSNSALPTTDASRLQAFIDRELVRRGDR
jgi:hypothetical protein